MFCVLLSVHFVFILIGIFPRKANFSSFTEGRNCTMAKVIKQKNAEIYSLNKKKRK